MNVLVWSSWVARPVGGQERVALQLALGLRSRGHKVVLAGAYDNAPELRRLIPADMPFTHFDLHRRRCKPHIAAARLLARLVDEHQVNAISAHGSVFAPREVCVRRGLPLIWTIHGVEPRRRGLAGRVKAALIDRVLNYQRTHVVAVSEATAQAIRERHTGLDPGRLHVIHNAAPDEPALVALPAPQPGPPWALGFIGRVVELKRPLDLVEVAHRLEGVIDFRMHVFGDGPLLGALRETIRGNHLEPRFVLHGYWDRGCASMIEQLQVLVHTSSAEGFGLTLLEAHLGGRPVVAYDVGAVREIVEHGVTGWLSPAGDVEGLVNGVRALTGADYRKFATAARTRAVERFSLTRTIEQYEALLGKVCASH